MSAETIPKRRGRPKKADKILVAAIEQPDLTTITTTKRSIKSQSITADKTSSTAVTSKKPIRRKKLVNVDEIGVVEKQRVIPEEPQVTTGNAEAVPKQRSSKSSILEQATAFAELNEAKFIPQQELVQDSAHRSSPNDRNASPTGPNPSTPASEQSTLTRSISIPKSQTSSGSSSQASPSDPVEDMTARSSFLSSFLSDTPDTPPEAPESAKISDRSAFKTQSLSIDDIVSGAGVSDLAMVTATIEQEANAKRPRQSMIPVKAPKTFKSHGLSAFPDKSVRQQQKTPSAQKSVDPEMYKLSSFRSLKTVSTRTIPATQTASISTSSPQSSRELSGATSTSTSPSTQSSKLQPSATVTNPTAPPSPKPTAKTISPPKSSQLQSQPQLPPQTSPQQPQPQPSQLRSRPLPRQTVPTLSSQPPPQPQHHPKTPTQMTPAELLKNAEFKSLRRKWTGVIVGIPVLVVTSWLLWERLDKEEKAKGWIDGGIGSQSGVNGGGEGRRRGELPPRRILEDGGLERK